MTRLRLVGLLAVAAIVLGGGALLLTGRFGAGVPAQASGAGKPALSAPRPLELAPAEVVELKPQRLRENVRFSGSTQPIDQTVVKSRVSARLAEVLVREGDRVVVGQRLARFEIVELQARLNEKQSSLEAARAEARWADKDRRDKQALVEQRVVSRAAFEQASAVADAKASMVAAAEAQLDVVRKNLQDAIVVAPIAGIVGERFANPGESLPIDGKLMTLLDTSRIEVAAQVPGADVVRLRVGQRAIVQIEGFGERVFEATITRISPTTQSGSRSVLVFVGLTENEPALRGGLFSTGRVTVAETLGALALPLAAIRKDEAGDYVLAIREGKLERQAVRPGQRWPALDVVEIAGIAVGTRVVSANLPGLKPGQAVAVTGQP